MTFLINDYLSYPTNTLYVIKNVEAVPAPAFTFCPKPSTIDPLPQAIEKPKMQPGKRDAIYMEKFQTMSVSLRQVIHKSPRWWLEEANTSTTNGETIIHLKEGM